MLTEIDWLSIEAGKKYHVDASDGERLLLNVISVSQEDELFVYDIIASDHSFQCPTGHVLRRSDIDSIKPVADDEAPKAANPADAISAKGAA
jgi:hypothetical protein